MFASSPPSPARTRRGPVTSRTLDRREYDNHMAQMTWKEFKAAVDKAMQDAGIDENTEIWFIDISFPAQDAFETGQMTMSVDDTCGMEIC